MYPVMPRPLSAARERPSAKLAQAFHADYDRGGTRLGAWMMSRQISAIFSSGSSRPDFPVDALSFPVFWAGVQALRRTSAAGLDLFAECL